jgi:hypothetical protein
LFALSIFILRLSAIFFTRTAKELIVLLILFSASLITAVAQHEPADWNAGTLVFKDSTMTEGFMFHDQKNRSIIFKRKEDDPMEYTFAEMAILSMKYYDRSVSRNREFYVWEVNDDGSTVKVTGLYEVLMVMKSFVVLSRKFGVLPPTRIRDHQGGNSAGIDYDKVEKIFLSGEGTSGELLWLGSPAEGPDRGLPDSQIKPVFVGEVMKKYTFLHWPEVKSFVKKNKLKLKRRSDLMETLVFFQQLEKNDH